eukprot:4193001-Amphidinium_carterae.3
MLNLAKGKLSPNTSKQQSQDLACSCIEAPLASSLASSNMDKHALLKGSAHEQKYLHCKRGIWTELNLYQLQTQHCPLTVAAFCAQVACNE